MQTAELIADLEKGLEAAKELAGQRSAAELLASEPAAAALDTSQMPGGVDSAPVGAPEPTAAAPAPESTAESTTEEGTLEKGHLDLLAELKDGIPIAQIVDLVRDSDGPSAVHTIVKAISDLAQGVRI